MIQTIFHTEAELLSRIEGIAECALKGFQKDFIDIGPYTGKKSNIRKTILHYFVEIGHAEDCSYNPQKASKIISQIDTFIKMVYHEMDFETLLSDNNEINAECYSAIKSITFDLLDTMDKDCCYDKILPQNLIILDLISSDASIINDCTHALNKCWLENATIVYISICHDNKFPVNYYTRRGKKTFKEIDYIANQYRSCSDIIAISKQFNDIKHEIINEKVYLDYSWNMSVYAPIPHLYFRQVDHTYPRELTQLINSRKWAINFPYESTLITLLYNLHNVYSNIHIFVVDTFGELNREFNENSYLNCLVQEFSNRSGYTVDTIYALHDDYGTPIYQRSQNELFVVINILATHHIIHSQAIPLTTWLAGRSDQFTQYPETSAVYPSLFISLLKENRQNLNYALKNNQQVLSTLLSRVEKWSKVHSKLAHSFSLYNYIGRDEKRAEVYKDSRELICAFKNDGLIGDCHYDDAFQYTYNYIKDTLCDNFGDLLHEITFFCIPTSTKEKYFNRFESISSKLCNELGMTNAFNHVRYVQDGEPKHKGGRGEAIVELDPEFFYGKNIIMFDDTYSQGRTSMYRYNQLMELNANVVALITLAKNINE